MPTISCGYEDLNPGLQDSAQGSLPSKLTLQTDKSNLFATKAVYGIVTGFFFENVSFTWDS